MNFTILSLSLSSIYTLSPIFVNNRFTIQNSDFNNFYCNSIFLNPIKMKLERSIFIHGLGSLIYSNHSKNILDIVGVYPADNYTGSAKPFDIGSVDSMYMIIDCYFKDFTIGNNYFINIYKSLSFYIRSCTFQTFRIDNSILKITSRANTISHICCYDVEQKDINNNENSLTLFFHSSSASGSFVKFLYTSLLGTMNEIKLQNLITFESSYAVNFQCNNISKFKLTGNGQQCVNYGQNECINMLMNTLSYNNIGQIIFIHPDPKKSDFYNFYIGQTNFYNNDFLQCVFKCNLKKEIWLKIDECIFKNPTATKKGTIFDFTYESSSDAKITLDHCYVDNLNNPTKCDFSNINIITDNQATLYPLAHYTYDDICPGLNESDPAGCQNNSCPVGNGCDPKKFDFADNDYKYETQFPGVPTPTPSFYFSESEKFSYSVQFTFSDYFSNSAVFSKTFGFSVSCHFTYSTQFSESTQFSKSTQFSESIQFSKSTQFSESKDFTSSFFFSNSCKFSETNYFSKSNLFSNSIKFTKSADFTKSFDFSKSLSFMPTNMISQFSESVIFSKSADFTKTNEFSKSGDFSKTNFFTFTYFFTKSLIFSISGNFTDSPDFSSSHNFILTKTLNQKSAIIISVKSEDSQKLSTGIKVGIGLSVAAAVSGLIAIGLFLLRRKKLASIPDLDEETIDVTEDSAKKVVTANPLISLMNDDDPFMDEFENEN